MAKQTGMRKNFIERLLPGVASVSLLFLLGIAVTLVFASLPVFQTVSVKDFIFGTDWRPTAEPPSLGIWSLIVASFYVTVAAILFALPLGLGSAVYIAEIANPTMKEILKPIMEILAGIPSVVFGFFGIVFVAPIVQKIFHLNTGLCGFTAAIILGIMAIPTISSISEDAVSAISKDLRNASFALGANKWETIIRAVIPAAKSGIFTAVILGISRAMGETMTVLMVAGGAVKVPSSLFDPMRPLTATIAGEMGEAVGGSAHYHVLFFLGVLLFVITALAFLATPVFNAVSRHFEHEADRYGLEVIHGIVPNPNQVAAHYFAKSGETNLSDPDPSTFIKVWFYDHPTRPERVHFVATYDPWSKGKTPKYVK
ncbi:MAG: phosphate ABC transporter permease subunit PstC [Candidatus Goldiibacteriota bacterium]